MHLEETHLKLFLDTNEIVLFMLSWKIFLLSSIETLPLPSCQYLSQV
jgi:hypothetical protein